MIGGYDSNNKLPYTLNWTFDIQYQASNSWLLSVGYVGNHGVHEVLPIPFNQPGIATAANPIHGQTSSYGGLTPLYLNQEPYDPAPEYAGNAPGRVPYIGYDMNSVLYEAEGISNYNALQVQARKRLSNGLQFTGFLHLVACARRTERARSVLHGQQSVESQVQLCVGGFRPNACISD